MFKADSRPLRGHQVGNIAMIIAGSIAYNFRDMFYCVYLVGQVEGNRILNVGTLTPIVERRSG